MFTKQHFLKSFLVVFFLAGLGFGQENKSDATQRSVPVVTTAASADAVRFTAPSNVVRMQLQIISENGQILFDVSSKGNVLDWTLQDSAGQHLGNGSYLCVVTAKRLSGKLNQRIGSVSVNETAVGLQQIEATQLPPAQQQTVGPVAANAALTILK